MSSYSRSYSTYSYDQSYQPPPNLQPVFSALASAVLLIILIALASSLFGLSPLAPFESLNALQEMAALGVSSLLGKAGLSKVDWSEVGGGDGAEGLLKLGADKGKMVRRYRDTSEGAHKAAGGGRHYPGLLNAAGNLCFLNATLQSLASLPSLLSYLDSLVASALEFPVPTPVSTSLLDTLEALNTPSTSQPAPLRPLELANALAASSPLRRQLLSSREQQDAHELWGIIRDAVEEESRKLVAAQEKQSQTGGGLAEAAKLKAGLGIALSRKKTVRGRNDPWFWLRSQRVRCMTCGYVRDTRHLEEELIILEVPPVTHCTVYDLLQEYTKPDPITDYVCRKCSMLATLSRLEAQRDRLALVPSTSSTPTSLPPPASPANPFELPPEPPSSAAPAKMTSSSKERRRKIQKLVEKVQTAVDANDYEKDLGEDVKLERAEGAAGKMVKLARTPDIFLLHLNRASHYGFSGPIKNSCAVTFPEYLDLSPFCDGTSPSRAAAAAVAEDDSSPSPPRDLYRLSSLVVHFGSATFGHYVSFRRRPGPVDPSSDFPEWYRISDETVSPSSLTEALRANPFLLFYERFERSAGQVVIDAAPRLVERWRAPLGSLGAGEGGKEGKEDAKEEKEETETG
ncbi:hypothetical protein JCM8547_009152 [Rhodosporidiobolus lusitaniae]